MKKAIIVVVVLLGASAAFGQSHSAADACKAESQKLASVMERANSKPPLAQFRDLIGFLDTITDDPTDCVSSTAIDRISKAERRLLVLTIGRQALEPDWVFHCNEFDPRSAWCRGAELDTSSHLPEEGFAARMARPAPPHVSTARLEMPAGYGCTIIGSYGSSTTALQKGKPAVAVPHNGLIIETDKIPVKNAVLIVGLRCDDKLRFRKVVWHLY